MTALIPAAPALRPPSDALAQAIAAARPREAAAPYDPPPPAVQAEAAQRLATIERALSVRPDGQVVRLWLARLVALIGHPSDADEIEMRISAAADALADLPRRCFTAASATRVAIAAGRFFPDLRTLRSEISAEADDLRREVRALRLVTAAAPPPDPPRATPEQLAAMREAAAALVAELRAKASMAEEAASGRPATARIATDPDTPEDEVRALAASGKPGAALARMRLAVAEMRRERAGGQ